MTHHTTVLELFTVYTIVLYHLGVDTLAVFFVLSSYRFFFLRFFLVDNSALLTVSNLIKESNQRGSLRSSLITFFYIFYILLPCFLHQYL